MRTDREPIDIVDPLVDVYKITEASRDIVRTQRRIIGIECVPMAGNETTFTVRLNSELLTIPRTQDDKLPGYGVFYMDQKPI